jgi:hypothetical protein
MYAQYGLILNQLDGNLNRVSLRADAGQMRLIRTCLCRWHCFQLLYAPMAVPTDISASSFLLRWLPRDAKLGSRLGLEAFFR